MDIDQITVDDVLLRLRKVEGQVRGIVRMIEEGRDCRDVVRQISAASRALDQSGFKLLASGLRDCLRSGTKSPYTADELEKMFLQLA